MNLNTVTEVKRPASTEEIPEWREGYAWLAGGTWLFSTPQIATHTLIDLEALRWPALQATDGGLDIAATPSPSSSAFRRRRNGPPRRCCDCAAMRF
jgi:hypothetical protein